MNNLKDKIVLITGAGRGSGRVLSKAFAERGAIIAANDISPINVEEVVHEINREADAPKRTSKMSPRKWACKTSSTRWRMITVALIF